MTGRRASSRLTDGVPISNVANAALTLRHDPAWTGGLAYDDMARTGFLLKPVPRVDLRLCELNFALRPIRDEDVIAAQEWLQVAYLPKLSKDNTHSAVDLVARENTYHPIREYLDALVWDGTGRLSSWFTEYLGVARSDYAAAIGKMFLISMVARVYDPDARSTICRFSKGNRATRNRARAGSWAANGSRTACRRISPARTPRCTSAASG